MDSVFDNESSSVSVMLLLTFVLRRRNYPEFQEETPNAGFILSPGIIEE